MSEVQEKSDGGTEQILISYFLIIFIVIPKRASKDSRKTERNRNSWPIWSNF